MPGRYAEPVSEWGVDDLRAAAETAVEQLAASSRLPIVFAAVPTGGDLVVIAAVDPDGVLERGREIRWCDVPVGNSSATNRQDARLLVAGLDEPIPTPAFVRAPMGDPPVGVLAAAGTSAMDATLDAELALATRLGSLVGRIAALAADAAAERERATMAEAESLFDALTGLGNRRHWSRVLESEDSRCRRHGLPASIIVADLDGLKEVNDALGHAAGDDVLRRAGGVLREISRTHDAVARLGGDEFGLLAVDCGHETAEALAQRVRAAFEAEGIAVSIGFAGRHPAGGLEHAWRRADTAMYADKRHRGRVLDLTQTAHPAG